MQRSPCKSSSRNTYKKTIFLITTNISHSKKVCSFVSLLSPRRSPQKLQKSFSISTNKSHPNTDNKLFIFFLAAASSCIFLTLSLRLVPSFSGIFLILLHVITIGGAISAANTTRGATNWHGADMVATALTAILQGLVSVLVFTRPSDFLENLEAEDDGVVILKLAGGLSVVIFLLEWVVLTMVFFLKGDNNAEGMRTGKVQDDEYFKSLPDSLPVQLT